MKNKDIRICIVSFSARKNGNCIAIGNYINDIYNGSATLFSFEDFSINPCGKCNYECFKNKLSCPYIKDMECLLIDNIISHDLTYFIVPNYCDYPCSNFFIFSERQQCYFQTDQSKLDKYEKAQKKFIVVSNTGQDNFEKAFSYHVTESPEILYLSARQYDKKSLAGDILSAENAKKDVEKFILGE